MFHINEALDGKCDLTVKDGVMTAHITLAGKGILNLYVGKADDAASAPDSKILQPTIDKVTYSDGTSEEVFGFDVPIPDVNKDFDLALIGSKGKWYDHVVSVSDPVSK